MHFYNRIACAAALLFATSMRTPCFAQQGIRLETKVSYMGIDKLARNGDRKFTILCLGDKARQESSDGTVLLFEGSKERIYTIDNRTKTYFVQSFADRRKAEREIGAARRRKVNIEMISELKPDGKSHEAQNISGVQADPFSLHVRAKARPKGIGVAFGVQQEFELATGTVWTGELDRGAIASEKTTAVLSEVLWRQWLPAGTLVLETITRSMGNQKKLPLVINLTFNRPGQKKEEEKQPPAAVSAAVTAIKKDVALAGNLFTPPADYSEVPALR